MKKCNDLISFVIPALNEEDSLIELVKEIKNEIAKNNLNAEIIFIDDGSTDNSYSVMKTIRDNNENLVSIYRLRKNFGKSTALQVGFLKSQGKYIITLDADLQDDPKEIPRFLDLLINDRIDLVVGWKEKRLDPWHKTLPSKLFNWATSLLIGVHLHDYNCGFKGYRRCFLSHIKLYGEMHRFIPAFAHHLGYTIKEIPIHHKPRRFGRSKYGVRRLYRGLFDLITVLTVTKYFRKPLHLFGGIGFVLGGLGVTVLSILTIGWFFGHAISGRPLFFAGILALLAGLNLTSIGLIGELLIYLSQSSQTTSNHFEKYLDDPQTQETP
jgi:glycosyltransferase involved in cell wall biosynthesis